MVVTVCLGLRWVRRARRETANRRRPTAWKMTRFENMDLEMDDVLRTKNVAYTLEVVREEYAYTLRVDEKTDVYSFGVVLLELVTGRRPLGDFGDEIDLVHWTRQQSWPWLTPGCRQSPPA
ncbi:unnamed protein product [Miscanthus lutarioriparius]|uniref:Serine-threonine/tyrosine-protein kinase catalytic domain-containing protein n=1 Tax=Miscanthus lutarioriparius TaxID=422564 RepID=A0A811Q712_9POAL|nr:unnamed protein product [Miscanthus lutarioriparius]